MPELHLPEDEALRYMLGEMSVAERREFEARLDESAELRALVRELEEGAVALAMTAPKRRPPRELLPQLEQAIAADSRRNLIPAFWARGWHSGWTAAAACLVGWLLYALLVHKPTPARNDPNPVATVNISTAAPAIAVTRQEKPAAPPELAVNSAALKLLQARTQEIGALTWQIAELTNRLSYLAQAVAQQQALLSDSSRLKFFELTTPTAPGGTPTATPISTNLQRALFIAMARELGWLPPNASGAPDTPNGEERSVTPSGSSQTNQLAGVDFVDLRSSSNAVETASSGNRAERTQPRNRPQTEPRDEWGKSESAVVAASSGAVPGFISGTNAVLAFDSSVVPVGTVLSFWSGSGVGQYQIMGTARLSSNPLVVTMPYAFSWEGGTLSVLAGMGNGQTNFLGHFSAPAIGGQ